MDLVWSRASKGFGLYLQHGQLLGCYEVSEVAGGGFGDRNTVSPWTGFIRQDNRVWGEWCVRGSLLLEKPVTLQPRPGPSGDAPETVSDCEELACSWDWGNLKKSFNWKSCQIRNHLGWVIAFQLCLGDSLYDIKKWTFVKGSCTFNILFKPLCQLLSWVTLTIYRIWMLTP